MVSVCQRRRSALRDALSSFTSRIDSFKAEAYPFSSRGARTGYGKEATSQGMLIRCVEALSGCRSPRRFGGFESKMIPLGRLKATRCKEG